MKLYPEQNNLTNVIETSTDANIKEVDVLENFSENISLLLLLNTDFIPHLI